MPTVVLPSDSKMAELREVGRFICTCTNPLPLPLPFWGGFECDRCYRPVFDR